MFKKLVFLLLMISLGLVACQSDNTDDSSTKIPENSDAPTPTPDPSRMTQAASNGLMFFADADTLYMKNGDEVETIAENILPRYVHLAPSKTQLLYTTSIPDSYEYTVFVLDLATLTSTQLYATAGYIPMLHSWSPNEEWVIITDNFDAPKLVIKLDGTQQFEFSKPPKYDIPDDMEAGEIMTVTPLEPYANENLIWLADNTLLVYSDHYTIEGSRDETQVYQFDPYLAEKEILEFSVNTFPIYMYMQADERPREISTMLEPFDLHLFPNFDPTKQLASAPEYAWIVAAMQPDPEQGSFGFELPTCGKWSLIKKPVLASFFPESLYEVNDTLLLSDVSLLDDESVVFVHWQIANCLRTSIATATILHVQPDGEVIELTETPALADIEIKSGRRFIEVVHHHIVDIAPDNATIVFIRNDEEVNTSALVVMDIATQQEQVIYEAEGSGSLTDVFWGTVE